MEPRYKTDLSFRVLGRLIARPVNVGDTVEQGEIVAAIDPTALELAVRSAKADLSRSQAQLANASATEERQRTLIATDTTSKETLDNAVQVRAGAQASVARAQANLTKAIEQLSYAQVKADFAGVVTAVSADVGQVVFTRSDRRHRRTARRQRGRRRYRAGLSGPVAGRLALYGQLADSSQRSR